jgi:hypothetical protein
MHANQLLGDVMLRTILLFRQLFPSPDRGKELADLVLVHCGFGLDSLQFVPKFSVCVIKDKYKTRLKTWRKQGGICAV